MKKNSVNFIIFVFLILPHLLLNAEMRQPVYISVDLELDPYEITTDFSPGIYNGIADLSLLQAPIKKSSLTSPKEAFTNLRSLTLQESKHTTLIIDTGVMLKKTGDYEEFSIAIEPKDTPLYSLTPITKGFPIPLKFYIGEPPKNCFTPFHLSLIKPNEDITPLLKESCASKIFIEIPKALCPFLDQREGSYHGYFLITMTHRS